ncbi:MAG TPA: tetratricopeptide repeat protein [Chthoniobacter sp.]|jgi:tetratricopeptide (TPR) repeat protein
MPPRRTLLLGALLFVVVAAVFAPTLTHGFISYDDPTYVTENAHVTAGLTWAGIGWAFRSTEASNWHPLTWVSHMVDCQLFGLNPWGHHATSVLLHALNAVLLFLALRRLTGKPWGSLFVAALFGLHPLHVEAVAWVAERKEVLSAFFWMLALLSYARRAELTRNRQRSAWAHYAFCLGFFALGLMSKPMVVTLPCVLLLLDFWPLDRWRTATGRDRAWILMEKIPFFVLAAAACAVTLAAQAKGGAVGTLEHFPLSERLANALIAYCWYLGKMFLPTRLAIFYPYGLVQPTLAQAALAGCLLAAITVAAILLVRRRPYLLVGWLWFLGTLVPVIGLIQVGGQSKADRYSYLPLIGIFLACTWAVVEVAPVWKRSRRFLAIMAGLILVACAGATTHQLGYWKDGLTLFQHARDVTDNNWVAHSNLAIALAKTSPAEAEKEYQATLKILATFAYTYVKKGMEQERLPGHLPEAIDDFRTAIEILPILAVPHNSLGVALAKTPGGLPEAAQELRKAIQLKPDFVAAHYDLASVLASLPGSDYEAIEEYRTVIRLAPDDVGAHFGLGRVLARLPGRRDDAVEEFEAALRIRPDLAPARQMIERLETAPAR